jgi:ATP-dependent Clp protease ATP-binding subunit ClpA
VGHVSVSGQRICRLADEAADAPSPEAALGAVRLLREELNEFERQQVARALSAGRTFGAIAASMGTSRQAVHRRFSDLRRRRKNADGPAPTAEVRLAFEYAQAEARALEAPMLGPEHVVLGILRAGDRYAARALEEAGVELDDARRTTRVADAAGSPSDVLRAVLADAVRHATRAGARDIEVTHVLRAALGAMPDPETRLGVPPERVIAGLDAALADCVET